MRRAFLAVVASCAAAAFLPSVASAQETIQVGPGLQLRIDTPGVQVAVRALADNQLLDTFIRNNSGSHCTASAFRPTLSTTFSSPMCVTTGVIFGHPAGAPGTLEATPSSALLYAQSVGGPTEAAGLVGFIDQSGGVHPFFVIISCASSGWGCNSSVAYSWFTNSTVNLEQFIVNYWANTASPLFPSVEAQLNMSDGGPV